MIALFRFLHVYGEPDRIRLTPQPRTPEEQEWVLKLTDGKGYFQFEVTKNSMLLAGAELGEINYRLHAG